MTSDTRRVAPCQYPAKVTPDAHGAVSRMDDVDLTTIGQWGLMASANPPSNRPPAEPRPAERLAEQAKDNPAADNLIGVGTWGIPIHVPAGASQAPRTPLLTPFAAPSRAGRSTGTCDKRGQHERTAASRKRAHGHIAWEHYSTITGEAGFSNCNPCKGNCAFGRKCGLHFPPIRLIRAHEYSFGTETSCTGSADDCSYSCELSSTETHKRWKLLAQQSVVTSAANGATEKRYLVDGMGPVCVDFWQYAYGITESARNRELAEAGGGKLTSKVAGIEGVDGIGDLLDESHYSAAMENTNWWWTMWLALENQAPNDAEIWHRNVIWHAVYEEEYAEDMRHWFGEDSVLSESRWFGLRKEGLKQLSIEWYGSDDRGEPLVELKLVKRANHSNFGGCNDCDNAVRLWGLSRKQRHSKSSAERKLEREEIFAHALKMRRERTAASKVFHEALGSMKSVGQYDDAVSDQSEPALLAVATIDTCALHPTSQLARNSSTFPRQRVDEIGLTWHAFTSTAVGCKGIGSWVHC